MRRRSLWPGVLIILLGLIAIPFATRTYGPVYQFLRHLPLSNFYSTAVQFPSPTMVVLLVASILVLQPRRRTSVPYFLVAMLLAGTFNGVVKFTTSRARPEYSIQMGRDHRNWIIDYKQKHPNSLIRAQREDQWLGLMSDQLRFKDGYASFPSGHANACFVMAEYLGALYPQARIIWYLAAGGTCMARVAKGRHWPEDVLVGGGMGWIVARIVFSWYWPGQLGMWLAQRLKKGRWSRIRNRAAPSE